MERRLGPPRIVRLDQLPPDQARAIKALVEMAAAHQQELKAASAEVPNAEAAKEGDDGAPTTP